MFDVDISKGYVDMPVPEGIDLVSEIERMKREKMLSFSLITTNREIYRI